MCHLAGRIDVGRYGPNFNRISFFICDYFPQEIRERGGGECPPPLPIKTRTACRSVRACPINVFFRGDAPCI